MYYNCLDEFLQGDIVVFLKESCLVFLLFQWHRVILASTHAWTEQRVWSKVLASQFVYAHLDTPEWTAKSHQVKSLYLSALYTINYVIKFIFLSIG